ncbi:hypothetical protein [Pectinatus frisingensis]|uniref:hypothetical protein n=1 Tax=Pectinatus frisingensis TaxID=865 RepID=UPI0018C5DD6A|nr:hypothetical protein [Pectinatus frisingensis]
MSKKIRCPICIAMHDEYYEMIYKSDGFFKCPHCGGEFWPNELPPDELEVFYGEMAKTHYSTDALPAGEALKGRGGSGNGKKHKAKSDKPSTTKLYKQLFKET